MSRLLGVERSDAGPGLGAVLALGTMRMALSLITSLLLLTGFSSAQDGQWDREHYYKFSLMAASPREPQLSWEVPGRFPNPPRFDSVKFASCATEKGFLAPSFSGLRALEAAVPDVSVTTRTITVKDITIACEAGALSVAAPTFGHIMGILDAGVPLPSALSAPITGRPGFEFHLHDGYRYPTIRQGFYYSAVAVDLRSSMVSIELRGSAGTSGVVVGFSQGGELQPVFFDNEAFEVPFDPDEPFTLTVYRGSANRFPDVWDYVEVDYNASRFTWWRSELSPDKPGALTPPTSAAAP